jgi:hypothetical protein
VPAKQAQGLEFKKCGIYTHGIYLAIKMKSDHFCNMDWSGGHFIKWTKPGIEWQMHMFSFIYGN